MNNRKNQESNRLQKIEELFENPLLAQIPSDPQPAEITEILAKNPSIIAYIGNEIAELDLAISNIKLLIKHKNRELDRQKSEIRLSTIKAYRNKLETHLTTEVQIIEHLISSGYTRVEAKEIAKLQRPEKPREVDLADTAEVKTKTFYRDEIEPLEQELIELKKRIDDWKVKRDLFENNFKASQSIKGLIQSDRNNFN
ncbi:hypothetical protein AAGG74_18255 [Bacillus mexicanus]|uniref:hypothetical protein n=1 Tax=Bacillus mexicanus TaxID=2834415 RepID=UPI003D1A1089